MIEFLKKLQADTYILLVKTHGFHWNVQGPRFNELHTLFQSQYEEMFAAVDEIAERLRSIDVIAPGSFREFLKISDLDESKKQEISSEEMLKELVLEHKKLVSTAKELIKRAENEGDDTTADLAIRRVDVHEKSIWMLKSSI